MPLLCLLELTVVFTECHYAECPYAECHYAESPYAECHYAECPYAECCCIECDGVKLKGSEYLTETTPAPN